MPKAIGALILEPTPAQQYEHLTQGGEFTVRLTQEQACVVLQAHDYGIANLPRESIEILDRLISTMKQEIWT